MKPVLIRQHVESAPAGLLAAWLDARGLAYEVDRSWLGAPLPDPGDYAFVASLGHDGMAGDTHDPAVAAERELLARAVDRDVPVLGLCYGGQVLAAVLGAQVGPAPVPELGWREIETDDPGVVPAGPWLEWHFERFCTPPGATELARTADAPQAFRSGPHLGVQFHPEATVDIVAEWARADAAQLARLGIDDGAALLAASRERRAAAEAAAFQLFDGFLTHSDQLRKKVAIYGDRAEELVALIAARPELAEPLEGGGGHLRAEVVHACTHEGALHLDDVLERRTRLALTAPDRGLEAAAPAAALMAGALDWAPDRARREAEAWQARVVAGRAAEAQRDDERALAAYRTTLAEPLDAPARR